MSGLRAVVHVLWMCGIVGCEKPAENTAPDPTDPTGGEPAERPVPASVDEAFRIDLSTVDVTFDIVPDVSLVGHAELVFTMRPGQVRPLFHFDPELRSGTTLEAITSITLDGEPIDPLDEADLKRFRFEATPEESYEIQRDVDPGAEHTLVIDYAFPGGFVYDAMSGDVAYPGRFYVDVNDIPGRGGEYLFPTINAPDELARHTIEVRIDDPRDYLMIGSGSITEAQDGDVQVFRLDTGREISSYTVLFAAMPRDEVDVREFEVDGVPVTLVSDLPAARTDRAVAGTRLVMRALAADFGPFPMPSMQILLLDWWDGMEYYGGTITGLGALSHEIIHMYFGTSLVNATWRDTWIDEAVTEWWGARGDVSPLPDDFASDMVIGRNVYESGFDTRAYGRGAQIFGEVAAKLGGDDALIAFLADLRARRVFQPFTTDELVEDLVDLTGDPSFRDDFDRWVQTPQ